MHGDERNRSQREPDHDFSDARGVLRSTERRQAGVLEANIERARDELKQMRYDRFSRGTLDYGKLRFLSNDTLQNALEEIADCMNWLEFLFVKVHLMKEDS